MVLMHSDVMVADENHDNVTTYPAQSFTILLKANPQYPVFEVTNFASLTLTSMQGEPIY